MRKFLPAIVLTLFLTAVIPLTYYLVQNRQIFLNRAAPTAALSISPGSGSKGVGSIFDVTVNLEPGGNTVAGVQYLISFDKTKLQVVDSSGQPATQVSLSGIVIPSPMVLHNTVDNNTGRIDLVIATNTSTGYSGTGGPVSSFKFKVLAESASSEVRFEPAPDTAVSSIGGEYVTGVLTGATYVLGTGQAAALDCTGVTLSPNSMAVNAGDARTVTAAAAGGTAPITYSWAVSSAGSAKGNFSATSGQTVTWTAPAGLTASQSWTLTATARDSAVTPATDSTNCSVTLTYTQAVVSPTPSPSPTPGVSPTPSPSPTPGVGGTVSVSITSIASGDVVSSRPVISGKAGPYANVSLTVGGQTGAVTADSAGNWSRVPSNNLSSGSNTATARATDTAGNITTASVNFTVSSSSTTSSSTTTTTTTAAPQSVPQTGVWENTLAVFGLGLLLLGAASLTLVF